jgi:hypothetical protein
MSIETSSTKLYLRELAPMEAIDKIESFRIPSPYKEILIACCVEQLDAFPAIDYLEEKYQIHISYWTYVRQLKKALILFRNANLYQIKAK